MTETLRTPPGPRGLPWVGSLPQLMKRPLEFYRTMTMDFGPIAFAQVGPAKLYFVSDPALIDELLNGKHKSCIKDAVTRSLMPLVGHGLLTSEGEQWKRQRKLASQPFSPKRITSYADSMVEAAERAFARFVDGERRDFHVDSMALALEIAGTTLLGVSTREEAARVAHVTDEMLQYFVERMSTWLRLLPPNFPTRKQRRFARAKRELDAIVKNIIATSRRNGASADSLLARLINARGEDGQAMSEQLLLDEAITMLLAGHETTGLTLTYCVYLLSRHPAAAARLQAELDAQLHGRAVSAADVPHLPYLDAVIREAMRLYPPAYAFGREVVEPFELGGYTLPVGAQVVVSTFVMHRKPEYFPEPERFLPERWLAEGPFGTQALPRYAYLPFGGGHRVCIGMHFAQLEVALVLATLAQRLELHVVPGFELELQPVITMRSRRGMPVRVRRRKLADKPLPPAKVPSFGEASQADAAALAGCPHAASLRDG
ncbi:MAG: Cytochrome family protein [Myxococcaceae bacterium]|nr:Cytochrome family protein [Myxococcaceae bacterium]